MERHGNGSTAFRPKKPAYPARSAFRHEPVSAKRPTPQLAPSHRGVAVRLDPGLIQIIVSLADQYADTTNEEAIRGRPSLLDHEGHRITPWGAYLGDPADPSGVRDALAYLRYATRPGSPNITALVESATLSTALVFALLPQRAAFAAQAGLGIDIPELIDVGPVIGAGEDSLSARYDRRVRDLPDPEQLSAEAKRLALRIDLGDQLITAVDFMATADHDFEWKSDLQSVVQSSQRWSSAL